MNRRELIKLIATATGTALVGANAFAWDVAPPVSLNDTEFSEDDVAFLNEVAETIVPRTETPGAKDANVGQIMVILVSDCYSARERKVFIEGMVKLNSRSKAEYKNDFPLLTPKQKFKLLTALDEEAKAFNLKAGLTDVATSAPGRRKNASTLPVPHYFSLMKQLTLFGFFTSEIGATKVLRYVPIPGSYNGELPYKKGDRAWAT